MAVEDDALLGDRLGQILYRLRLAGTGWASGSAAEEHVHRAREGKVNTIREGGDDETRRVAEGLAAVAEGRLHLPEEAVVVLPVGAELRDPLKGEDAVDTLLGELVNNIARMHLNGDEGAHVRPLQRCKLLAHRLDHHHKVFAGDGGIALQRLLCVEVLLAFVGPINLIDG